VRAYVSELYRNLGRNVDSNMVSLALVVALVLLVLATGAIVYQNSVIESQRDIIRWLWGLSNGR